MSGTLVVPLSDRFRRAAERWAEQRVMDEAAARSAKAEQALLEIEHLVSGADDVEFDLEGGAIRYEPSEATRAFLRERAEATSIEPETVLELYVDLFAGVFLEDETVPP